MTELHRARRFAQGYVWLVLALTYLPILVVVIYSFNVSRYGNWGGFTLRWYEQLMRNNQIRDALLNSLQLAIYSSAAAAIIGTAGAVGLAKSHFRGQTLLENFSIFPMMIPEIILGMAYLTLFTAARIPFGMVTLVIAHTVFCVPYILINVQSRLVGLPPAYAEAARDLGASPAQVFRDITLPLIAPAIFSGVLISFAMSMDDVVISFFVTGPRTNTLPLRTYSMLKTGITPEVNALCTLMLVVIFLCLGGYRLVRVWRGRRKGKSVG